MITEKPKIPMSPLFDAVDLAMDTEMRPLHYADLTALAIDSLGIRRSEIEFWRVKEDVREKMLEADWKQRGYLYLGKPDCYALKKSWLPGTQLTLFPDELVVAGSAKAGVQAAFDGLMRSPYMISKTSAPREAIMAGRARGLVIESHVRAYFKNRWPQFYHEPDNHNDWTSPCNHDFKLELGGRVFEVDVFGPNVRDEFKNPGGGKRPAHLHIAARLGDDSVSMKGVFTGTLFGSRDKQIIPFHRAMSPRRLVFWLNCAKFGHDHSRIAELVATKRAA